MAESATHHLQEMVRRSVALHRSGRLEEAEVLYRRVLESDPANPDALNLLGILVAQHGRPRQGARLIREAIAIRPAVADFHCNLGHVERLTGESAAAETAYREALSCQPGSAAAAQALGVMLADAGRLSEAVKVYRGALAADPNVPDIWFNLSAVLNQLGQLKEAEIALRRVLVLRPTDVAAYANLATLMLKCARIDAAIEACHRGLAVAPKSGELHFGLGRAFRQRGNYQEAAGAFRKALTCDPALTGARGGLIAVLRLAGELEAAVDAGREAATEDATSLIHAELGLALVELGRLDQALAAFQSGVAKDPHQVSCYAEMGWLLHRLGREAKAQHLLDFDQLAVRHKVTEAPGYQSVDHFNRELAAYIVARSDLVGDLPDTATQGGQQTATLFSDASPIPQTLKTLFESACRDYIAHHKGTSGIPFFASPPAEWSLNSNAVVLRSGGYQDVHIHPSGYVSGVYYVKIPSEISEGDGVAGCLYFTEKKRPAAHAQLRAIIRPQAGEMVLFPSYFWHGVAPFEGGNERICVAFDVIPTLGFLPPTRPTKPPF